MRERPRKRWLCPAATVIRKFSTGNEAGASLLARELRLNKSSVYRWMYDISDGGTGGIVPAEYHRPLLRVAKHLGVGLSADDIIGTGVKRNSTKASPPLHQQG